jgi:GNAT superfamily N-acetyltransferase
MSVCLVSTIPRPSRASDQWGYLTDCYTRPPARDAGVGTALLAHVREWAAAQDLELLLVSPSERAEGLYRRAGFEDATDFLRLTLRPFDEAHPG